MKNYFESPIEEFAEYLFASDRIGKSFSEEEKAGILSEIFSIAHNAALEESNSGIGRDPVHYIRERMQIEPVKKTVIEAYSDYVYPDNIIHLYLNRIEELYLDLKDALSSDISKDHLINIILIHEYFHYLEKNKIGDLSAKYSKKGIFGNKKFTNASEIGAFVFSRMVTGDPEKYLSNGGDR